MVAILSASAAAAARWAWPEILGQTPYLAFYPAVVAAAALGGAGPGLLATALSLFYVDILFDVTPNEHLWNDAVASARHLLFIAGGIGISIIAGRFLRSRDAERQRSDELAHLADTLKHTQQSLELALEGSHTGVWNWDIKTGELTWSQRCRDMFGVPEGSVLTYDSFVAAVHPDDRARINVEVRRAVEAHQDYNAEMRTVLPDGSVRWVSSRGRCIYDSAGQPVRMTGVALDITQTKNAQEALRQSQDRYRAAAEELQAVMAATPAGICVAHDPDCRRITGNRLAHELLGVPTGDNISATPRDDDKAAQFRLFQNGNELKTTELPMQAACLSGQEIHNAEIEALLPDGTRRVILLNAAPVYGEDGKIRGAVGAFTDITQRKRAEEALKQAKHAAEEASRAKDQFLAVLSHELRTPLTPVLATASMLEQDHPDLNASARDALTIIRRNVELEARLIDDLLDVTRIARGKVELDRQPVAMCQILQQTVDVCKEDIAARKLHFGIRIEEPPHIVLADSARLQQVFWNLIKNAVKFTPHGGCVGVRCWREGNTVIVEVKDSGQGIEAEALPRIFNAFEQAERNVTRRFGGLGLGLTISKAMVELHGGSIHAHSEGRGHGAVFTVRLPVFQGSVPGNVMVGDTICCITGPKSADDDVEPTGRPTGRRILLVEDHGDTARVMSQVLARAGYQVHMEGDLAGALSAIQKDSFDLLVSDLGLPDGSGMDLMRELRRRGSSLPGIALSGFGQEEDLIRSHEAGFSAHLIKPITPARLAKAIDEVWSKSRTPGPATPAA